MIADKGWGVTNYDDYMNRITDDYLLYRSPVFAFDFISYRHKSKDSAETYSMSSLTSTANEDKSLDLERQYRVLSAGITFRYNESFLQVKNDIKTIIDSYDSTAYSSNVDKSEAGNSSGAAAQKTLIQQDHAQVLASGVEVVDLAGKLNEDLRGKNTAHLPDGSPKLHPPMVEDYDALMQGVPLSKYKVELKRIRIEVYAKTEPETAYRMQRKLPSSIKTSLPFMLLYFDKVYGTLATPLNPDKLVHTTCQLPDKPQELLNACYDTYDLHIKDFSMGLITPSTDKLTRLLSIPQLQLSYGTLLQAYHWKNDEVPIKKLDLQCDVIKFEFTKREFIAGLLLFNSALSYQPLKVIKIVDILNHSFVTADNIGLSAVLTKLIVKQRFYHTFGIWNLTLAALHGDVLHDRKTSQVRRCNIINTQARMHNNQSKWLEMQLQYPNLMDEQKLLLPQEARKPNNDSIQMAVGVWIEKFNLMADKNLLDFLSFVLQEESKLGAG